jgi:predicted GIY-YIG superfamily endonuclease
LFFVYAVECEDGSYYIGQTEDLRRRWDEHQKGQGADWTRSHKALRIVHFEEFDSREAAVQREKDLKTGFGRKWLKEQIQSGRARQAGVAVARQRAENDLADLQRTQKERMAGLDRLAIARHVRALPFQDPLRIRSRPAQDSRGIHKLFAGRPTRALSAHYPLTIRSGPA